MKKNPSVICVHFPVLLSFCLDGAQLYSFRCNACFQHKMGIFCLIITDIITTEKPPPEIIKCEYIF